MPYDMPSFSDIPRHSPTFSRHSPTYPTTRAQSVSDRYCISGACVGLARSQQRRFEVNVATGFQTPGGGAQPGFGPFITWFHRQNDPVLPSFLRGTGLSTEPGFRERGTYPFRAPRGPHASRNPVARGATRFRHQGRKEPGCARVEAAWPGTGFVKPVTAVTARVRNRVLAA